MSSMRTISVAVFLFVLGTFAVLFVIPHASYGAPRDFTSEGQILLAAAGPVGGDLPTEVKGKTPEAKAKTPEEEEELEEEAAVADPLHGWNKAMFTFNDRVYFWFFKPVARGYKAVVPEPARIGVRNFFHNILMPVRFINCLLQGKMEKAKNEIVRFTLNSTWGVLGFVDISKKYYNLPPQREDLGQTFGVWGMGNGFYIVWPLIGPSTVRDSFGLVGDYFLDPVSYVNPLELSIGIRAFDEINATSLRIGDYEALKAAALDPYVSLRDAYIQNRKKQVGE